MSLVQTNKFASFLIGLSLIIAVSAAQAETVTDTFTRTDGVVPTDSIGDAEVPASTYHWYESDLTWDNTINSAAIQSEKVQMLANGRQVTLNANFQDVSNFRTDVIFSVGEGTWPAANAMICLRKGTLVGGAFVWSENAEKVSIQFAPSGYITVMEGGTTLYSENPWTGGTSWHADFGAPGALPATLNGLPFDVNQDGRIAAAETLEAIILGASLVGTDLAVTVNGAVMWSGTVSHTGSSTGYNYISLANNTIGGPATVTTIFDNVGVGIVPEPVTLMLFTIGSISMVISKKRK